MANKEISNVQKDITVDHTLKEKQLDSRKDKGWAWVIVAGVFVHLFIFVGLGKSFGLFFVEFLRAYETNSSLISGILSAQNLITAVAALLVLNLGPRIIGPRTTIISGSLLEFGAYLMMALVPGVSVLVISQGFFYGVGVGCTTGPLFVVLNNYFEKKLGFATMVAFVGGSIGGLVMPTIIKNLLDEYGLQGALLIVSGMLLNNIVVGALARPISKKLDMYVIKNNHEEKYPNKMNETIVSRAKEKSLDYGFTKTHKDMFISVDNVSKYYEPEVNEGKRNGKGSYAKLITKNIRKGRSLSEISGAVEVECTINKRTEESKSIQNVLDRLSHKTDLYANIGTTNVVYSTLSLNVARQRESKISSHDLEHQSITNSWSCCGVLDFRILKNRHLLLILFVCFVSVVGCGMIIVYVPPFAKDSGVSNDNIVILVTVIGTCDLMSRFSLAWISDSKFISRGQILSICLGITGTATMFNPLYTNFYALMIYCVLYGFCGNCYFSLVPLIIRESVGVENYPAAYSLMILIHGISFTVITPLLGLARDVTGCYTLTFYIMGSGILIGCIAIMCEPLFKRMEENRIKEIVVN